ncbi:zinc finger protein 271-like isoform X2 [Pleurodeles waltl]|uniref:zinc finger protein 271-like isoform X2 n=1 Tax=Pleurodeles waltl TaxID=8319 RepID=UPI0037095EB1
MRSSKEETPETLMRLSKQITQSSHLCFHCITDKMENCDSSRRGETPGTKNSLQQHSLGVENQNTGNGSMHSNGIDGEPGNEHKVMARCEPLLEKSQAKVIQTSEKATNCGNPLWPERSQELGSESTQHCESEFIDLQRSVLQQRTYCAEASAEYIRFEGNLRNADLPMSPSNAHQYRAADTSQHLSPKNGLFLYQQLHGNPKRKRRYQCPQCEKSFHLKTALQMHSTTHTGAKPHQCHKCEKCYSMKAHLVNHLKFHTRKSKLNSLPIGEKHNTELKKNINREGNYKARVRRNSEEADDTKSEQDMVQKWGPVIPVTMPNGDIRYKCTECEKYFKRKSALYLHCKTHTGENPYQCAACKKSFRLKSHLVDHQRSHAGDRPFKCTKCEKSFTLKATLMSHYRKRHEKGKTSESEESVFPKDVSVVDIAKHNSEKPYPCSHCDKSFTGQTRLVNHQRCHTGELPYQCTKCEKRFGHKGNLLIHTRSHDKVKKNPHLKVRFLHLGGPLVDNIKQDGKKAYECARCERSFSLKAHLAKHLRRHEEDRPYQCTACEKQFRLKGSLMVHFRRHHGKKSDVEREPSSDHNDSAGAQTNIHYSEKPHQCPQCKKSFQLKAQLVSHLGTHTEEKPFHCPYCEKCFRLKGSQYVHISRHHAKRRDADRRIKLVQVGNGVAPILGHNGLNPYQCTQCDKRFRLNAHLVSHQRIHNQEKPYSCTECEKRFSLNGYLLLHMRRHHAKRKYHKLQKNFLQKGNSTLNTETRTSSNQFQCNQCDKSFRLRAHLGSHKRKHKREKHQCTECGKSFHRMGTLLLHQRTHKDEKPYKCTMCEKRFRIKTRLVIHQRTHTGEKPFQCPTCEKRFSIKAQFLIHQRTHTGERPFQCITCEKKFNTNAQLVTHQRTHTGERPYLCTQCEKRFSQKGNLLDHIRRRHNETNGAETHTETHKANVSQK